MLVEAYKKVTRSRHCFSESEEAITDRIRNDAYLCIDAFFEHYLIHNIVNGLNPKTLPSISEAVLKPKNTLDFPKVRSVTASSGTTYRAYVLSVI